MKLDYVVRPGREHSNGVRRRDEDSLAVPGGSIEPLDGRRLLATLRRICHENGVTFEPLLTENEIKAAGLAAEALLQECMAAGIDTRDLLQTLARNWGRLRAGVLRDDAGRQVFLPGPVCFLSFYRWRQGIIEWLEDQQ
jgi:hypothetical protein